MIGSYTILLKDLLGVAKDGLDYVETWVSLKSPVTKVRKAVDAEPEAPAAPDALEPTLHGIAVLATADAAALAKIGEVVDDALFQAALLSD